MIYSKNGRMQIVFNLGRGKKNYSAPSPEEIRAQEARRKIEEREMLRAINPGDLW